ncbi:peptidase MA superfamily [Erannis ankeraria nucleopolyhedrovirus]|uniref:peptidase MA superfamily n=1 Tax=Erannis ankeraria nucleopolyhedrovirus TaxID=2913600 RepID=UPI002481B1FA|nr:peptidase MA superfamily [Erannis ankeraria nucleopolyhedrovirus]UJZ89073.1 peptidase MA superfamily [Erannis ankeraria nucleopolyhedrovirus]
MKKVFSLAVWLAVVTSEQFDVGDFPTNLREKNNVNHIIDNVCVNKKFKDPVLCDGLTFYNEFEKQTFNFRRAEDIEKYGVWLRLLNNVEYYNPHNRSKLIEAISNKNMEWALINGDTTADMKYNAIEVFRWVSDTWLKFHIKNDYAIFESTLSSYINFFNTFPVWCGTKTEYFFKTALVAFRKVRLTYRLHMKRIDVAAANILKLAIDYPLFLIDAEELKNIFYISYVSKVQNRTFFKGLYSVVDENKYLPHENVYKIENTTFVVHHNVIDKDKIEAMRVETEFAYNNLKEFLNKTKLAYNNAPKEEINVYVHDNKKLYEKMGDLWSILTNNGGYTHRNRDTKNIESHVYYNGKLVPWNYGHELVHALMNVHHITRYPPSWFAEGLANRIGNHECYVYDHDSMKAHLNSTVKEIVLSDYNSPLLYGMGSALVDFLYETRPDQFGEMISHSKIKLNITKYLEYDFYNFKINKIAYCNNILMHRPSYKNTVLKQYSRAIQNVDFGQCKNWIKIEFNDTVFYMTRYRLFKASKSSVPQLVLASPINRYINQYDYNWFLNGVLKRTFIYFGDTKNHLKVDDAYSYTSNVSCDNNYVDPTPTVVAFGYNSGVWDNVEYLKSKNFQEGRLIIQNYLQNLKSCNVFLNPAVSDRSIPRRLTNYADNIVQLKNIKINDSESYVRLDVRGNTILHLLALHNQKLYDKVSFRHNVLNYDGLSAENLYSYVKNYVYTYGKSPNRYCYTMIENVDATTTSTMFPTLTVDYSRFITKDINDVPFAIDTDVTTIKISTIVPTNTNKIKSTTLATDNYMETVYIEHEENRFINKIIILLITFIIFIILIYIAATIFFVMLVIKNKINSSNNINRSNNCVKFNKHKFYEDNDCTTRLFE